MKTTATPKDILFVTMLSITCLVGYFGFSQSAKIKSEKQQLSNSENFVSTTLTQKK
jgi:hypothetical protein